ncbi:hypothetical protein ACTQ54_11300 [Fundicoccus sp. Sow4_H7]|uniref:hypothetical protein n=1 Tax=Fundicoccus sp. Sow4_H7 TaxID=3438784 RepID=UPI003F900C48
MSVNKAHKLADEFFLIRIDNGATAMIPKVDDFFVDATEGEYYLPDLDAGYVSSEVEWVEVKEN